VNASETNEIIIALACLYFVCESTVNLPPQ